MRVWLAAAVAVLAVAPAAAPGTPSTVWLCHPDRLPNPCKTPLDVTVVRADGTRTVRHVKTPARPPVDCFYVYPTVSTEDRLTSDRVIHQEQVDVARSQASRFSEACRVFAPMYRQVTLHGLLHPELNPNGADAYYDVLAAWREYLARWNRGRGVVLIGHSQGTYVLESLMFSELDAKPAGAKRLVSALLLGGDVVVAAGSRTGGTFTRLPACSSTTETRCVVAYSSWYEQPPAESRFERVADPSLQVMCVNPAAPGGGTALLTPMLRLGNAWYSYPGRYRARCATSGSLGWLDVDVVDTPGDSRFVEPESDPLWGLHGADVSIALGNLVALVRAQAAAYTAHH